MLLQEQQRQQQERKQLELEQQQELERKLACHKQSKQEPTKRRSERNVSLSIIL